MKRQKLRIEDTPALEAGIENSAWKVFDLVHQPEEITQLQHTIRAMRGCESTYDRTEHVHEVFQGKIAWDGIVRVFTLVEHLKAECCYAWSYREGNEIKSVAVLKISPVDSAQSAVKVAIASETRH